MSDELIFLAPVFKERPWGGNNLKNEWGFDVPFEKAGECWSVSAHQNGECTSEKCKYAGMTLSELWREEHSIFGSSPADREFPLMVKILDAESDLSVQVHPDDDYAFKNENGSYGKSECWYVLDAKPGAKLVMGHNAGDKAELRKMIEDGKWSELLREVPVKKGDFLMIEPGTVHAIGGGMQILETQQSSDVTYRLYDYDRIVDGKRRELHIEKSIDVALVPGFDAQNPVKNTDSFKVNVLNELGSNKYFTVYKAVAEGKMQFDMPAEYMLVTVIEGAGSFCGCKVKKGDSFIVPSGIKRIEAEGDFTFIASSEA